MADTKSRELSVKINVDVSEALTGLKAVQREAKKATQALRELESMQASEREIGRLVDFILAQYPHEIGRGNHAEGESAVDVAIRLLGGETR